jgi:hypothetical protein
MVLKRTSVPREDVNDTIVLRLRGEFMEMPGLRLTMVQVQRLCGVERTDCEQALDTLVDAKFLCRNADGTYARLTDGENTHPHPAKAHLPNRPLAEAS